MSGFTKKAIVSCFSEMLKTTPFDKITVSALVSKCGISSNTFYYHFKDIYDLLEFWLQSSVAPFMENKEIPWQDNIKALFHYMKENEKAVYHVMNALSRDNLERYMFSSSDDAFDYMIAKRIGTRQISD